MPDSVPEDQTVPFFATTPRGMEGLLADELRALGAPGVRESRAGVHFGGIIEHAYRACLFSRLASRVLFVQSRFEIAASDDLYEGARAIPWDEHLFLEKTFSVDAVANGSPVRDGRYAALLVKDAIADVMRDKFGQRPDVGRQDPDFRINVSLIGNRAVIALDFAGESLHRRGYRTDAGPAPLKENLAYALVVRSGWTPETEGVLLDPLCGSGTILIEAAQAAAAIAPGAGREGFGFFAWRGHDAALWKRLVEEAHAGQRQVEGVRFLGYDENPRVLSAAKENARRAGVSEMVRFERRSLKDAPSEKSVRIIVTNPPYGKRLGGPAEIVLTYAQLGAFLKRSPVALKAAVFTAAPETLPQLRLRADRKFSLYNGPVPCVLALYSIYVDEAPASPAPEVAAPSEGPGPAEVSPQEQRAAPASPAPRDVPLWPGSALPPGQSGKPTTSGFSLSQAAGEFRNRLSKNAHRIVRWAAREGLEAFRVYDADLPAYNACIDVYGEFLVIQEYRPPAGVDAGRASGRLQDILLTAPDVLGIDAARVVLRERRRTRGSDQYEKLDRRGEFLTVREYDARFLVNLHDYLDTGLFSDHRLVRRRIQADASGVRFLNLYGYTGSASVSAALGGAESTTTVDLSRTYLEWAAQNIRENRIRPYGHKQVQADCMDFLHETQDRFGLVFVNPPVFSTSKRMEGTFDVERDHVDLLRAVRRVLTPGGQVIFSTSMHNFVLQEAELSKDYSLKNLSKSTLPLDFERSAKDHHVWLLS